MCGIKIPQQDFALKMPWGLCARGAYLRDTTVLSFTCDKVMERNSGSYRHVSSDPDLQKTYRLSCMKLGLNILCTKLGVLDY